MKTLGEAQEMIAALKTDLEYAENERRKLAEQVRTAEEEYKSLESDFNHIDRQYKGLLISYRKLADKE